ncbi:MAG TPA: hypothetical protein VED63_05780 [Acidimicrobiales bacterium]|nr:hypothetical protein [Acidimicrobiales bacterium]
MSVVALVVGGTIAAATSGTPGHREVVTKTTNETTTTAASSLGTVAPTRTVPTTPSSTSPATTTGEATTTTTSLSTTTPAPTTQAVLASIASAYDTAFDFTGGSVSEQIAAVENGPTLRQAMTQAGSFSLAASAGGSRVSGATVLAPAACAAVSAPSPCVRVTFSIVGPSGANTLENATGYAVEVDGQWLVAKATMCGILGLFYEASDNPEPPPGCPSD